MKQHTPPRLARWLWNKYCKDEEKSTLVHDLDEYFSEISIDKNRINASFWYWKQVIVSILSLAKQQVFFGGAMFNNYLKIALRNIRRNKGYSFINISGLAVGMACCLLILIWINHEMSYDRFHENKNFIYRVNQGWEQENSSWTPYEIGRALKEEFPEVVSAARIYRLWNVNLIVKHGNNTFIETNHRLVDPSFFQIFSFPVIRGNPLSHFTNISSVVISDRVAKKYFEDDDPVGKVLNINNELDFTVSSVIHIPANTDFQFDFIFPLKAFEKDISYGWTGLMYRTFVQLRRNISPDLVEKKIWEIQKKHIPSGSEYSHVNLQKLSSIHLYKPDGSSSETLRYIYIFGLSGVFILLIACINFMNLSTARSEKRAKEIGLRKTIGAARAHIIKQFYIESFFVSTISFMAAIVLILFFLPFFNRLLDQNLSLNFSNYSIITGLIISWFLTAILSGSYPALFLSSFKPVQVIKGALVRAGKGYSLRKGLVIFQFSLSVFFIISTLIVYSQMNFIEAKYGKFETEHLVYVRMDGDSDQRGSILKNELLKYSEISNVTLTQQLGLYISYNRNVWTSRSKTPETNLSIFYNMADFDFIKTFKMEIIKGRDFSKENPTDGINCIINEEAEKLLGFKDPVDKEIVYWDGKIGKIIGVIKDYNYRHVNSKIGPLVLCARPDWWKKYVVMRLASSDPAIPLGHLRSAWEKINPGLPFDYHFFDSTFESIYRNEQILGKIFLYFTFMTIFISCLGLLGLVSFMADRRTKEIGIRKVLGATEFNIISLLSIDFIKCIIISNLVAWPLAFFAMNKWLQNFAYRTNIHFGIFILSAALALILALFSVNYHSIKAARANPVDSLRYE